MPGWYPAATKVYVKKLIEVMFYCVSMCNKGGPFIFCHRSMTGTGLTAFQAEIPSILYSRFSVGDQESVNPAPGTLLL
jgi:hypothetical protein